MKIALKFAYNGQNFYGFARQPNLKTVEGRILDILTETGYITNPTVNQFRYASRTDKGVSAFGNVIAFNTGKKLDKIFNEINLNEDIVFYGLKHVDDDFFPRYAKQRIYQYHLKNQGYNIKKIRDTISLFIGTHNFSNFARIEKGKNPIRTIDDIKIFEKKEYIVFEFYAQTYLWNQIRRIISATEKVCNEKILNEDITNALKNPIKRFDFGLSDAKPLILIDVLYNFAFEKNSNLDELKNLEKKKMEDF